MNKSESIKELATALNLAQSEFPPIPRTKTVKVKSDKGSYEFRYAPFEDILRAVRPALSKNGLSYTQGEKSGALETILMHKSGEWIHHEVKVNATGSTAQAYGSALTYARRYGFCCALGIQADDDDDGNAADGNHIESEKVVGDKRSRVPTEAQDKAIADFCAAIETADSLESLKNAWEGAFKVVSTWDLPMMVNLIESAKNKRKRDLTGPQALPGKA